jgi:DNA invertase Pin-like site-specific DNA recombinase
VIGRRRMRVRIRYQSLSRDEIARRRELVLRTREEGKTFREIGELLEVSSQRAHQICRDASGKRKPQKRTPALRPEASKVQWFERLEHALALYRDSHLTVEECARASDVSQTTLYRHIRSRAIERASGSAGPSSSSAS